MDEIKLFKELQPPPSPDANQVREAARARLISATSAPLQHPTRRRTTVVTVAAAAALAAGGASYGITAAQGTSGNLPVDSSRLPVTIAGLTAVQGCPGKYVTAGTLDRVSGTRLIIQQVNDTSHVTVATTASTAITIPATGSISDIADGSRVTVQGTWSGQKLAAATVAIQVGLPPAGSIGPHFPRNHRHLPKLTRPSGAPPQGPPFVTGTVRDADDGTFTVVSQTPFGRARRVHVITKNSTKVETDASATLSQLPLKANIVAVGTIGHGRVMTADTVTEPAGGQIMLPAGLIKIRSHGCSASAITTAAIEASG